MPLRAITPSVVEDFARELEQAQVGPEARRAVLVTLQSIFRRAVVWDRVRSNPIAAVRKPGGRRVKAIVPLAPATVEAIRAELVAESDARSAVLVSLLAYAGLRPEEALALRWRHVRERTLLVDSKNVDGELLDGQKVTGKPSRGRYGGVGRVLVGPVRPRGSPRSVSPTRLETTWADRGRRSGSMVRKGSPVRVRQRAWADRPGQTK
jgi:integrase